MKNKLLKILILLLLLSVSAETVSGIWANNETSIVVIDTEEKNNSKTDETEKEESKDKINQQLSLVTEFNTRCLFVLNHIYFKYSVYLSLPEIPPDQI